MEIKQFYDEGLAHASYAILSDGKVAVVDPGRDPKQYEDFAKSKNAIITAVFETHPHADFVSSHLEIHDKHGATIYVSKLVGADYPHKTFDDGEYVALGKVKFLALHTPGHSPDSLSILLHDENNKPYALFSGDTLFIGDVGRPDLREKAGNIQAQREELAAMMYHTVQNKLKPLDDHIKVYPAHGAGSLCGKNLSSDRESSIGRERQTNWAFGDVSEAGFVASLLEGQPYIPKYFGYDVAMNKKGAPHYNPSINEVNWMAPGSAIPENALIIDTRSQELFGKGHNPGAINIMDGGKFETWLGSVVSPEERFYLVSHDENTLKSVVQKAAKIGYEQLIAGAVVNPSGMTETNEALDVDLFRSKTDDFTIIDIRSVDERKGNPIFSDSLNIPLHELRERANEVPSEKPVVVHCAGGYRSAAGSSILDQREDLQVFDLSEAVKEF